MKPRILLVDDQQSILYFLRKTLQAEGFDVNAVETGAAALEAAESFRPEVVLLDMKLPDRNGLDILREVRERYPRIAVVMMTAFGDVQSSVSAMKLGAYDYLNKPVRLEELLELLDTVLDTKLVRAPDAPAESRPESEENVVQPPAPAAANGAASRSNAMREVYARVRKLAVDDRLPVLLIGEPGTGRGRLARLLHANSPRASKSFARIRCGAHSEDSFQRSVFGPEGLAEKTVGGSLLLEGIEELDLRNQLRVLELLDQTDANEAGVRILASSHADLSALAEQGSFRLELLVRLHPGRIAVPPLRRRREDILDLAGEFLREAATRRGTPAPKLNATATEELREYSWPGNVAELRRSMEAALALAEGPNIGVDVLDLRRDKADDGDDVIRRLQQAIESVIPPEGLEFEELVADLERSLIEKAYRISDGNQSKTAKLLKLNRDKLRYRMKAFNLI